MADVEIIVDDRMQSGYRYRMVKPVGRCFDLSFKPQLTPRQVLTLGVFGGKYMTDCVDEFPAVWFARAKLSPAGYDAALNCFGVRETEAVISP